MVKVFLHFVYYKQWWTSLSKECTWVYVQQVSVVRYLFSSFLGHTTLLSIMAVCIYQQSIWIFNFPKFWLTLGVPDFSVSSCLMNRKFYLIALIFIFLISQRDWALFHMWLFVVVFFHWIICSYLLPVFLFGYLSFSYWFSKFSIYSDFKSSVSYVLRGYFLPACSLSFYFV